MAYTKQNFEDGQVLKAEHLNKMEKGIEAVSKFGETGTVIVEDENPTFDDENGAYVFSYPTEIQAGDSLAVVYDGKEYVCDVIDFNGNIAFGNLALAGVGSSTGEPFLGMWFDGAIMIVPEDAGATSHSLKISLLSIQKLPLRFYDRQAVFYSHGADAYLYTDAKRTIKATKADIVAAAKKMPIVINIDNKIFAQGVFANTEGNYAKIYAGLSTTDNQLVFRLYFTAEHTG